MNTTPLTSPKTIVVGMSGGVDSSVVALLLKEQGHRVIGVFMKNWEETDASGVCTAAREWEDVQRVCDRIDIPCYSVEFVREYWEQVFEQFLKEYRAGYTPNPDVLCNREIKFNVFYQKALSLGADFLATGHYTRIGERGGEPVLLKGRDPAKDQSYFLNAISGEVLQRVLFPIGHLTKSEVRKIAEEHGIPTAAKKDSTGICFIGERDFREFLSRYLQAKPGPFKRLDGETVGHHLGSAYYTLGQRRGLGLGGEGDAWFVVSKDSEKNIVYVERGGDHPALFADWLLATQVSWISGRSPELPLRCKAKVRYRQTDQDCVVNAGEEPGTLRVAFDQPQRAITPGQSVVFYEGEICLGGAVIRAVGPSHYEQAQAASLSRSWTSAGGDVASIAVNGSRIR
jgi:tRNA-specific 2-thiouridylase